MKGRPNTLVGTTVLGAAGVLALIYACSLAGLRINTTPSLPVGLYWSSSAPIDKGAIVEFCPPHSALFNSAKDRGYVGTGPCPGSYGYLMKRVAAMEEDDVHVTAAGIFVNGELVRNSALRKVDGSGRTMPRWSHHRYTLHDGQFLLMGDHSTASFDSRYFGPIDRNQIRAVMWPVWTW